MACKFCNRVRTILRKIGVPIKPIPQDVKYYKDNKPVPANEQAK